ncbi:FecR family protein [Pararcticibacter amylolyticus]|uniref:FecR family protein n=1 Tax=Pararcticibacter amylolyticus TaxID=2173175 RepID=UPI0011B1E562|nr:FecR family protein [Pararcticibacter amylolyticus]
MNNAELKELFGRYLEDQCTPAEVEMLIGELPVKDEEQLRILIREEMQAPEEGGDVAHLTLMSQEVYRNIRHTIRHEQHRKRSGRVVHLARYITAAASVVAILAAGLYYFSGKGSGQEQMFSQLAKNNIAPGRNKAFLILADGTRVPLGDTLPGVVARQGGVLIRNNARGEIAYTPQPAGTVAGKLLWNTIQTPRGGQFQVVLPDQSRVWLNAESSLKYPAQFTETERTVELTGEAYFEVTNDRLRPFVVRSDRQSVTVLGTSFNMNAYADESAAKTTLLTGSVRVSAAQAGTSALTLTPGQQAVTTGNGLTNAAEVNTEPVVAWKNGMFSFKRQDIRSVMRQIARWYDVEVEYSGDIPKIQFTGKVHRNADLSQVLRSISYLGVGFGVEGRKITVSAE